MIRDHKLLRFSITHEWVDVDDDIQSPIYTIGISQFAADQLTDIITLQMPQVGNMVFPGTPCMEIETVKAISEVYSPVEGQIVEINSKVIEDNDLMLKDPYQEGWLFKIRPTDRGQIDDLLSYDCYQENIK